MTTPVWQPGTLYQPGDLVQPLSVPGAAPEPIANGDLELGNVDWTFPVGGIAIQTGPLFPTFQGVYVIAWAGNLYGEYQFYNSESVPVAPGQVINVTCRHRRGTNNSGRQGTAIGIQWLDVNETPVGTSLSLPLVSGNNGPWFTLTANCVAPSNAVLARVYVEGYNNNDGGTHGLYWDDFTWDYIAPNAPEGLVYRAVQANAGFSDNNEPDWPIVVGQQVVDNEVTWEAVFASRVLWEASPILVSGDTEPDFPTDPGAAVADNTIAWVAMDHRVKDPKCPNSKVVAIAASKIFAADDDIIPFSATVNPLDWSTPQDAGFLPFGLQSYGSNPCTALGIYRSNLVALNAEGYQMWQVDEDPANMAILDSSPVDCPFPRSVQPVGNDLAVLSARGIRSIGVAGASTNLQAGFFGKQIDPLVLAAIQTLESNDDAIGLFWPGAGQYWLFFGSEAFVLTLNGGNKDMSFSRYTFPSAVTDWAILGTDLYLRSGDLVWRVDSDAIYDDQQEDSNVGGDNEEFLGRMWWPYLDFGQVGVEKQLEAFDLVCSGTVEVQFGYDQRDASLVTAPYEIDGDTLPGTAVPMPLAGPSFQFRLNFAGGQAWSWNAANLYLLGELAQQ